MAFSSQMKQMAAFTRTLAVLVNVRTMTAPLVKMSGSIIGYKDDSSAVENDSVISKGGSRHDLKVAKVSTV